MSLSLVCPLLFWQENRREKNDQFTSSIRHFCQERESIARNTMKRCILLDNWSWPYLWYYKHSSHHAQRYHLHHLLVFILALNGCQGKSMIHAVRWWRCSVFRAQFNATPRLQGSTFQGVMIPLTCHVRRSFKLRTYPIHRTLTLCWIVKQALHCTNIIM